MDRDSSVGRPRRPKAEDPEDEILRLREENLQLKRRNAESDEKIKKMATKLIRLTADLKRKADAANSENGRPPPANLASLEQENGDLREQVQELSKKSEQLSHQVTYYKTVVANTKVTKPGTSSLRPTSALLNNHAIKDSAAATAKAKSFFGSSSNNDSAAPPPPPPQKSRLTGPLSKLFASSQQPQQKLSKDESDEAFQGDEEENAEDEQQQSLTLKTPKTQTELHLGTMLRKKLLEAMEESDKLRKENEKLQQQVSSLSASASSSSSSKTPQSARRNNAYSAEEEDALAILQREVVERSAQLTQLQNRYDRLDSSFKAVSKAHDDVLKQFEELTMALRKEKTQGLQLQHKLESLQLVEDRVNELIVLNEELRKEKNEAELRLNEFMLSLVTQQNSEQNASDAVSMKHEETVGNLKTQIKRLEKSEKNSSVELARLRQEVARITAEYRTLEQTKADALAALEATKERLREYEEEEEEQEEEMDFAQSSVQQSRSANASSGKKISKRVPAEEHSALQKEYDDVLTMVKLQERTISELRHELEAKTRQVEELELQQASILTKSKKLLKQQSDKLRQSQMLVKQSDLSGDLLEIREAGQNIFELVLSQLSLDARHFDSQFPAVFFSFGFYEHELAATPVVMGLSPNLNCTTLHLIEMDSYFYNYLANVPLVLELHQAVGSSSYETIGKCSIMMQDLLSDHNRGTKPVSSVCTITSISDARVKLGTLEFTISMRIPLINVEQIESIKLPAIENVVTSASASSEIRIRIVRCNNLSSRTGRGIPSPYVYYEFFDFALHETQIIHDVSDPEFDDLQVFPVHKDASLTTYLQSGDLVFCVFDDDDTNDEAYLGIAQIPLESLLSPEQPLIEGEFPLHNDRGESNGSITIQIELINE